MVHEGEVSARLERGGVDAGRAFWLAWGAVVVLVAVLLGCAL